MAKVRRASPKSSSPPPLQHRAKWRPNAKRSLAQLTLLACSLCSLLYTQDRLSFTQSGGGSTPQYPPPQPNPPTPVTSLHATTFRHPSSHLPSAVGDFGFQIVFVLLLPLSPFFSTPGPHNPPSLVDFIYSAQTRCSPLRPIIWSTDSLSSAARFHQRPVGSATVHKYVCVCVSV